MKQSPLATTGAKAKRWAKQDTEARLECLGRECGCQLVGFPHDCEGRFEDMHILSRRHMTIRWDPRNHLKACAEGHRQAHTHPKRFEAWLEKWYPGRLELLNRLARGIERWQ